MDTPDPSAPVPEDPAVPPAPPTPTGAAGPADPPPTAPVPPVALGPAGGWSSPPPPTAPTPPASAPGGAAWGPWTTPYGLAWGPTPIPPAPAPSTRHPHLAGLLAVAIVVSLLLGVGAGYLVSRPSSTTTPNAAGANGTSGAGSGSTTVPSNSGSGTTPPASGNGGVADPSSVAAKVDPGLVDINVQESYQGDSAAGTGQVLTSSGEVLTNNHVIDEATSISVTDIGNGQTYSASVVGYDRTGDLAVIQLHGASGLKTVTTGDSSKVTVGEPIVAIGNAGGLGGTPSVANGTVTTLNQEITASDDGGGNAETLTGLIQVDADVQPGDSGGPLVNSAGQVVGIDTAASSTNYASAGGGDGYAIPINTAIAVAKQIEAGRSTTAVHIGPTAFLGVSVVANVSECTTRGIGGLGGIGGIGGLGDGGDGGSTTTGAVVCASAPGSPAESAGFVEGDVITAIGSQAVTTPQSLSTIIESHSPGQTVQVTWTDPEGTQHTTSVQLASGPAT